MLCSDTNTVERVPASSMFIFIGALPRTDWLAGSIERDERGFILTGPDLMQGGQRPKGWAPDRDPFLLETNVPGVFVAGDCADRVYRQAVTAAGSGCAQNQSLAPGVRRLRRFCRA